MKEEVCNINFDQSLLNDGDNFTIEGVGIDSLGRRVINGMTDDGKKAKGDVTLTTFTAKKTKRDL